MITLLETPIERYNNIDVKREDLCAPAGAPPFSKIRGLVKHLTKLKQEGWSGVAYVETSVSMAGWGIAWACNMLDMKCLIFNPIYKKEQLLLEYHRQQWQRWGAEIIDIPAGRAKVNYYIARKQLPQGYKLLPLGIPLPETISETTKIAQACIKDYSSIVICVGSGTIAAGVYAATHSGQTLYGIMCRSGDKNLKKSHIVGNSIFPLLSKGSLEIIDMGWEYAEPSVCKPPFPCHPYYDAKAWEWLMNNISNLKEPILFWNIGSAGGFNDDRIR